MLHDWQLHVCGTIYAAGMASAWLIGQAVPEAPKTANEWVAITSVLGSLGFSIWFGWYTTTKTIPDMRKEHTDAMAGFVVSMKDMAATFATELREERQQNAGQINRLEVAIDGLTEQLRNRP